MNTTLLESKVPTLLFLFHTKINQYYVYKYLLKVSGVQNIYHDHCYDLVNHGIVSQSSDVTHESTRNVHKPESIISPSNDDTLLLPSPKRIKVYF